MVDIATVSVVSSGLVALGTIAANFVGGERQRQHETDLDFETRVWERKSEALFTVIQECGTLVESDDPVTDENRANCAVSLSKMLDTLYDTRATVEAFASSTCRQELTGMIHELPGSGVKPRKGRQADHCGRRWSRPAPIPHRGAATGITRNRLSSRPWLTLSRTCRVCARKPRLLEAARESVRRPKD